MKIAFHTLGCKLNYSETSSIEQLFEQKSYEIKNISESADIYVINTCSVTENANKKCRRLVKQVLKTNPNAYVVLIGCYAQLKPMEIAAIPGVDLVVGAKDKFNLPEIIEKHRKNVETVVYHSEINEANTFHASFSKSSRTRSFLKVQDGCDYKCTYCTIPLARGKSRSATISSVLESAKQVVESGIREIVLTGVNIGDFSNELGEDFFDLIKALDENIEVNRIRISSIEPNLLKDEMIEFVANSKRFMPHFHIPLQSGNNDILAKMKRRYKRELYEEKVAKIKSVMPDAAIGVDVIVGFPGETEEHFMDTYQFLNELDVSYFHVFSYSQRENTLATIMKNQVPNNAKNERSKMLRMLSQKKRNAFYQKFLDKNRQVLFESANEDNTISGFTDNYIKVTAPFSSDKQNSIQSIQLNNLAADSFVLF